MSQNIFEPLQQYTYCYKPFILIASFGKKDDIFIISENLKIDRYYKSNFEVHLFGLKYHLLEYIVAKFSNLNIRQFIVKL